MAHRPFPYRSQMTARDFLADAAAGIAFVAACVSVMLVGMCVL